MAEYSLASIAMAAFVGCVLFLVISVKNAPVCDEEEADKVFRKVQRRLAAEQNAAVVEQDYGQAQYERAA